MKKALLHCFLALIVLISANVYAQNPISGIVKDINGQSLVGVSVKLKNTTTGVSTDINGKYSFQSADMNGVLVFSFIGMKTLEVPIGGRNVIDVNMSEDVSSLKEVIVVGYGSQSRELVSTSVSKVDMKTLQNVNYPNVSSALQGTVSGVRVQTLSGMPGAAPRIIIRGGTSINNPDGSSPLYIVDGIIRTDLAGLDQNDLSSMQVLKDAAATSIYGARGSNGVVIVTTKSGQAGKTLVNYRFDNTFSNNTEWFDVLSAEDYIRIVRQGIVAAAKYGGAGLLNQLTGGGSQGTGNDLTNRTAYTTQYLNDANKHKLGEGWKSMADPIDPSKTIIFDDFDFQRNTYRTGMTSKHHISTSGGTEKAKFNAGLGYLNNDGTILYSNYKQLNMHLNGDLKINDRISVFGNILYSTRKENQLPDINTFTRSSLLPRSAKYKFEDGTLAPGQSGSVSNTEYFLQTNIKKVQGDDLSVSTGLNYKILPGLTFDPQVSLYQVVGNQYDFRKAFWSGVNTFNTARDASSSFSKFLQHQADAVFTYVKSLKNDTHNFQLKAGASYFKTSTTRLSAAGRDAATDLIPTLNASATLLSMSSTIDEQLIYGYFGRLNYDYKQKYLLTVNARYDGASNLGKNYKWGFFPGVSAGWNLHKEEFWSSMPENLISTLKLRTSYGVNGNISGLGPYTAQGQFGVGQRYVNGAAVINTALANSQLQWEQAKTLNGGVDIGLFDNRVNLTFDIFRRVTDNLITSVELPPSTGFASTLTNLGSLENKGFEIELNTRITPLTSAFQWDLAFNISKVDNKILKLPPNGIANNRIGGVQVYDPESQQLVWRMGLQEGQRIGDYYGFKVLGVYATEAAAAAGPTLDELSGAPDRKFHAGFFEYADLNNDKIINLKDMVYLGNMYPKFNGGISTSFRYKNFNLHVRGDYMTGQTIQNFNNYYIFTNAQGDMNMSSNLLRMWQKEGDITDIPQLKWGDIVNEYYRNGYYNDKLHEKSNFLAIREVTFTYDLPKTLVQKSKVLSGLRLSASGHNLKYITQYTGLNPEYGGQDRGRYPVPRNITFGLNATF